MRSFGPAAINRCERWPPLRCDRCGGPASGCRSCAGLGMPCCLALISAQTAGGWGQGRCPGRFAPGAQAVASWIRPGLVVQLQVATHDGRWVAAGSPRPAGVLRVSAAMTGPLEGVRALELGILIAGPFAGR